ncbi:MAG TPA: hypothetical protein VGY66_06180 [Gemmataceae bacterium]|nr:hypothetical protein [Gemmataceae bacterium]
MARPLPAIMAGWFWPLQRIRSNPAVIDLGEAELKQGANTLRIEAVGTNAKSQPPHDSWGLDCVLLKQAK